AARPAAATPTGYAAWRSSPPRRTASRWSCSRCGSPTRACGRSSRRNTAGAVAPVLPDLYAFAATAVAAIIVLATGFARADAIATLVVVALMLRAGAGL